LIPSAFNEIRGRLISGVGNILRVYEMGQKKLLRKFDNRNFKSNIVQIRCEENRIYVADTSESIHVLKFKPELG
jgi:splicing factor 3B subunit 3